MGNDEDDGLKYNPEWSQEEIRAWHRRIREHNATKNRGPIFRGRNAQSQYERLIEQKIRSHKEKP